MHHAGVQRRRGATGNREDLIVDVRATTRGRVVLELTPQPVAVPVAARRSAMPEVMIDPSLADVRVDRVTALG